MTGGSFSTYYNKYIYNVLMSGPSAYHHMHKAVGASEHKAMADTCRHSEGDDCVLCLKGELLGLC